MSDLESGARQFQFQVKDLLDHKTFVDRIWAMFYTQISQAEVAEQADAHDSKSCSFGSVGSIPTFGIDRSIISPPYGPGKWPNEVRLKVAEPGSAKHSSGNR